MEPAIVHEGLSRTNVGTARAPSGCMSARSMIKLGLLFALAACSTATEPVAGKPTMLTQGQFVGGCPLGVAGALATVSETDDGVAITFLTTPDQLDELRERARHAAALHGPNAKLGLGHDGAHGQGGHHGLQAFQLPPCHAVASDVEAGARITLVPADAADRAVLIAKATDGVRRMNVLACR
jgi:hypothetical protein